MAKYPHLIGEEINIWARFLSKYPDFFDRLEYDVRVGEGIEIRPEWEPEIQRMAKTLTQKRIDVIGHKAGVYWIIEIKPRAGLSALGQLLSYKTLYLLGPGKGRTVRLAVVTDRLDRDEGIIFRAHGVEVWVV